MSSECVADALCKTSTWPWLLRRMRGFFARLRGRRFSAGCHRHDICVSRLDCGSRLSGEISPLERSVEAAAVPRPWFAPKARFLAHDRPPCEAAARVLRSANLRHVDVCRGAAIFVALPEELISGFEVPAK